MVSEGDQHNNGRWLCLCLCASELLELGPRTRAGDIWASSTSLNVAWLRCTDRCSRRRMSHCAICSVAEGLGVLESAQDLVKVCPT